MPAQETFEELRERVKREVKLGVPGIWEEASFRWKAEGRKAYEAVKAQEEASDEAAADGGVRDEEGGQGVPSSNLTEDGWLYFGEVLAAQDKRGEEISIEEEVRSCFAALQGACESVRTAPGPG